MHTSTLLRLARLVRLLRPIRLLCSIRLHRSVRLVRGIRPNRLIRPQNKIHLASCQSVSLIGSNNVQIHPFCPTHLVCLFRSVRLVCPVRLCRLVHLVQRVLLTRQFVPKDNSSGFLPVCWVHRSNKVQITNCFPTSSNTPILVSLHVSINLTGLAHLPQPATSAPKHQTSSFLSVSWLIG